MSRRRVWGYFSSLRQGSALEQEELGVPRAKVHRDPDVLSHMPIKGADHTSEEMSLDFRVQVE
jgi:hypothetical protein